MDTNLAELRKQCMTSLYLCSDNITKYLDEEKEEEFTKLKSYVEDYCMLEAQEDVAKQALAKAEEETDASNVDSLQDKFSQYLISLANKRLNVAKHPYMLEMTKRIQRGMKETRNNLEESDLAITESDNRMIDPITKKPIEDPVRNSLCNHVYERASIMEILKVNRRTKCPVVGCGNKQAVDVSHLVSDEELMFRLTLNAHSTMIQGSDPLALDDTL
ncbi:E3 SUMO-protein ligase NSE2-like [Leguminivora glycinivorella]|uniref:E3 SUMO-protein ligase NSE2-like n=1 Tax=Leguminivora glycinivorella TaxID=1035111 RepID=UPI00200E08AA|nr:E3 SUMO-protein ligase NSE2-like [Leguminivora glycinivorella]